VIQTCYRPFDAPRKSAFGLVAVPRVRAVIGFAPILVLGSIIWRPPLPPSSGRGAARGHRRGSYPILRRVARCSAMALSSGTVQKTPTNAAIRSSKSAGPLKLETQKPRHYSSSSPGRDAGGAGVRGPEPEGARLDMGRRSLVPERSGGVRTQVRASVPSNDRRRHFPEPLAKSAS